MTLLGIKNLKRYSEIVPLLVKYGRKDLEVDFEIAPEDAKKYREAKEIPNPKELSNDLQKLGPLFVKLGQLLSTQTDLIPPEYEEELAKLQDKANTFPYAKVEEIFEEEFGIKISKAFKEFNPEPIASASISQVHRAVLRSGRVVAVKVQRPDIQAQVVEDINILEEIAHFLEDHTAWGKKYRLNEKIEDLKKTLYDELNFEKEASNLKTLRENLKEFKDIIIPEPIPDYTTSRILTMDFIEANNITLLSPVVKMEMDTEHLANELFRAYLKQILIDGVWHMDPHFGNVYLTPDAKLALLDMGMVGHIPQQMQRNLIKLIIGIGQGKGEEVAEVVARLGFKGKEYEFRNLQDKISKLVSEYQGVQLAEMPFGKVLVKIARISASCDIILPSQFNALGKTLINLDQVGKALAPHFEPTEAIRRYSEELINRQMQKDSEPLSFFHSIMESAELAQKLPSKIITFLDQVSHNEFKVKIDAIDETKLMEGFQKIANRITMGLILASMIIGGALLMRVDTEFKIWGYPGLAILLFLSATFGGFFLMMYTIFYDETSKK